MADHGELFFGRGLGAMMARERKPEPATGPLPGLGGSAPSEKPANPTQFPALEKKESILGGTRRLESVHAPFNDALPKPLWTDDLENVRQMATVKVVAKDKTKARSRTNAALEIRFKRGYGASALKSALDIAKNDPEGQASDEQLETWFQSHDLKDVGRFIAHTKDSNDQETINVMKAAVIILGTVQAAHEYAGQTHTTDLDFGLQQRHVDEVLMACGIKKADETAAPQEVEPAAEPEIEATPELTDTKKSAQEAFLRAAVDGINDSIHTEYYKRIGNRLVDIFASNAGKISFRSAALIVQDMLCGGLDDASIATINEMDDERDPTKAAESAKHRPISKTDAKAQMKQAVRDVKNALGQEEPDFTRRLNDWRPSQLRVS